jgi:hypothetical protein
MYLISRYFKFLYLGKENEMNTKFTYTLVALLVLGFASTKSYAVSCPYGPSQCRPGFVWREATPGDHVCVPVSTRSQVASDNAQASARIDPSCSNTGPGPVPDPDPIPRPCRSKPWLPICNQ